MADIYITVKKLLKFKHKNVDAVIYLCCNVLIKVFP